MMEISKLYFGRVWTVHEYCGNCIFHASSVDKKYRVFYLTEKNGRYVLEDIKTNNSYPIDIDSINYDIYFVYTGDLASFRDVYPILKFPHQVSVEDALKICKAYNEDFDSKDEDIEIDMRESLCKEDKLTLLRRKVN